MNIFSAKEKGGFKGPHQGQKVVKGGVPAKEADAAVVLIHGRGASAESIAGLLNEINISKKLAIRAPQANGFTWYPYSFLAPTTKNEPGLSSGLQAIYDILADLEQEGIPKEKVFILGFSQGACLASEYVARHPAKYAGLIALSGGLIGDHVQPGQYEGDFRGMPVFMGCSDVDPHIPVERVHESEKVFEDLGAQVTKKIYPGMGHSVNEDELREIESILNRGIPLHS